MSRVSDLSAKSLGDLTLDELVYLHVAGRQTEWVGDFAVTSSLEQIVSSMRSANSRENSKFYGPAMCAFAILDQIGTCYGRATSSGLPTNGTSIKLALEHFCGIPYASAEAQHLYAFRNAQMHDAAFVNKDTKGNWYIFRHDEQLSSVVEVPNVAWDGQPCSLGPNTTTSISRNKLVDLASEAIRAVEDLYLNHHADLIVRVDKTTLLHKYLLWSPKLVPQ